MAVAAMKVLFCVLALLVTGCHAQGDPSAAGWLIFNAGVVRPEDVSCPTHRVSVDALYYFGDVFGWVCGGEPLTIRVRLPQTVVVKGAKLIVVGKYGLMSEPVGVGWKMQKINLSDILNPPVVSVEITVPVPPLAVIRGLEIEVGQP